MQKGMTDYVRAVVQAWDEGGKGFHRALPLSVELERSPVTTLPSGTRVGLFQLPEQLFVTRVSRVIAGAPRSLSSTTTSGSARPASTNAGTGRSTSTAPR
jgi:hypothetical protein